jgi:maltose O-acetyltransferase
MTIIDSFALEKERLLQCATNAVVNFLPNLWFINKWVRPLVAKFLGMRCGSRTNLESPIFYGNLRNISIGNNSYICRGTFLDGYEKISIGNNVSVAFQVTFITSTHELGTDQKRAGKTIGAPIVVEDGVWIGARAIISPGTVIGAGSVVSAAAALMHSVPPNSLVAGVPARVIKRLDPVNAPAIGGEHPVLA